ncbi:MULTISPECIES: GspH/FimT family pseudopilin [Luteimonas]|uniref:GspH/FimT family pseudopilin n=1 Tax=Luteimonas TaxID=83614 RepID=UPI00130418E9|nr:MULTISPECIES: GspH/FimT family pseudopilin [Luteimonas]
MIRRHPHRRHSGQASRPLRGRGFTLLEVLVVVAIMGMAATAVMLTLPDDDATLYRQADDFGRRLQHARDEAILGGRTIQVSVDAAGYRFSRRDFGQWLPFDEGPFGATAWDAGVEAALPPRQPRLGFRFGPTGDGDAQTLRLVRGDARVDISVEPAGSVRIHAPGR